MADDDAQPVERAPRHRLVEDMVTDTAAQSVIERAIGDAFDVQVDARAYYPTAQNMPPGRRLALRIADSLGREGFLPNPQPVKFDVVFDCVETFFGKLSPSMIAALRQPGNARDRAAAKLLDEIELHGLRIIRYSPLRYNHHLGQGEG